MLDDLVNVANAAANRMASDMSMALGIAETPSSEVMAAQGGTAALIVNEQPDLSLNLDFHGLMEGGPDGSAQQDMPGSSPAASSMPQPNPFTLGLPVLVIDYGVSYSTGEIDIDKYGEVEVSPSIPGLPVGAVEVAPSIGFTKKGLNSVGVSVSDKASLVEGSFGITDLAENDPAVQVGARALHVNANAKAKPGEGFYLIPGRLEQIIKELYEIPNH